MIIGIDNILNWLETNKTPYWYVKDFGGTNLIFTAQADEETLALEDSKRKLSDCLKTLANGNYSIEAWQTAGQKKNWAKTKFQLTSSDNQPSNVGIGSLPSQNNFLPQKSVTELIEEALIREREKNRIDRLETDLKQKDARIKELEAEIDSLGTRIGKRFDQVFGGLLDMNEKASESNAIGSLDEESEKVALLMERWSNADPQFISALEGLVKLAESDPNKYAMGKKLIM